LVDATPTRWLGDVITGSIGGVVSAGGGCGGAAPGQGEIRKAPTRVLQPKSLVCGMYSPVNQKVQSSTGSTDIEL
jgi:hypothetical protein